MNLRLIPAALAVVFALAIIILNLNSKNNSAGTTTPTQQSVTGLKELTHFTGISFPAESKIMRSEHEVGQQQHIYAVLHMSHDAALDFTRQMYQQGYSVSKTGSSLPDSFNPWLAKQEKNAQPVSLSTIKNYRAMEMSSPTRSGSLLADFDRPKVAVLYVYYELA